MKSFIIVVCFAVLAAAAETEDEKALLKEYIDKFAAMNMDEILNNDRLFSSYHKCFLDKGPCTGEARDFKKVIPKLIENGCEICSEEQKRKLKKGLTYLQENRAKEWEELLQTFDPKREALEKYLRETKDL